MKLQDIATYPSLENRVVVITGGGSGIGASIVERFCEQGSKVYFVDPGSNPAIETSAESWQIAYTMGGVSIKVADTSIDNAAYTSGTSADKDGRTIALTFAF